jgi:hypothetical protein
MERVNVTIYTDPGCPFGFNAQRQEAQLAWTQYPLATAEVAELAGVTIDDARTELERYGARFSPVAGDGYWSEA